MADWILVVISCAALVWSILQTYKQQELSNKHHLWDKRMMQYRILQGLMNSYQVNIAPYLLDDNPIEEIANASDMLYEWLTNCEALRTFIPQDAQQLTENKKTIINDLLHDSVIQISVLWNEEISASASKFISAYRDLTETLHHQANVIKKREELSSKIQHSKKEIKKLRTKIQVIKNAYDECINNNILSLMSNTLILKDDVILKQIKQWFCTSLNSAESINVKDRGNIIDIHDKRLSQLFKVCYIAAPGFASALLAHSTLTDNADIVAKYTIPAIITATAAVVLWIITHALSAGRCFDYSALQWNNYINHSNETYQHTLDMIKCALIWIFTVFIASILAQHQQPNVVPAIKMLDSTCSPITTGILFLNLAVIRWTAKHVIGYQRLNTILTYLTYGCGLLWTTHIIWIL